MGIKPRRAAAIIKVEQENVGDNDLRILLVQDGYRDIRRAAVLAEIRERRADAIKRRKIDQIRREIFAEYLVNKGRLALVGGGLDEVDYKEAAAESVQFSMPKTSREKDLLIEAAKKALMREIEEELRLTIKPESIQPVWQIQGENRDHFIFSVTVEGVIKMLRSEINGLGILRIDDTDLRPSIPYNPWFYQRHVFAIEQMLKTKQKPRSLVDSTAFSHIELEKNLAEDVFIDDYLGYLYVLSGKDHSRRRAPERLHSGRNFFIYDDRARIYLPEPPQSSQVTIDRTPPELPTEIVAQCADVASTYGLVVDPIPAGMPVNTNAGRPGPAIKKATKPQSEVTPSQPKRRARQK